MTSNKGMNRIDKIAITKKKRLHPTILEKLGKEMIEAEISISSSEVPAVFHVK